MRLGVNTTYRSSEKELMDNLEMEGKLLYDTLDKIAGINSVLGGNAVVLNGIEFLVKNTSEDALITVIDLGCGNGAMLRTLANYLRKQKRNFRLIGVDANAHTLTYAKQLSKEFDEIHYINVDVFSEEFNSISYDIATATLFMHHFDEKEILSLVQQLSLRASLGVVINDLHRHWLSYYLFRLFSLFYGNEMTRYDGAISILRGFKKTELVRLANRLKHPSLITWKWAFRYQWIIQK